MAAASTANLLMDLRLESWKSNGAVPLLLPKPTWVVRTESNVGRKIMKKPDPPCVVCKGSGRVDCHYCHGRGRTNHAHVEMLPKGEWPKWCKSCGGSGLSYCSRCLGTGEYRYIMGFNFMKRDNDSTQDTKYQIEGDRDSQSTADRLLHREQTDHSDN
ncbi:Multidrug resistance protein ABC transporter family [Hibiscus syriacus]|uniref:Multidrug resistance protein ABC transporter family n=1 Tax=Hibiscus syriacus TaxID=106335 RepID=A0A6A2WNE0_HIBSY|nr:uncharacterized protein LOC120187431 [Hibiscus syriacus]KAE8661668.1 Multidrug resistance protein ABC transporter family [Hibiscus syriacus]